MSADIGWPLIDGNMKINPVFSLMRCRNAVIPTNDPDCLLWSQYMDILNILEEKTSETQTLHKCKVCRAVLRCVPASITEECCCNLLLTSQACTLRGGAVFKEIFYLADD